MRSCDSEPISSPLLTLLILTSVSICIQIFQISFTIYHVNKQPEVSKISRLCVFSQSIGLCFLLFQLFSSGASLSSIYNWHTSLISCQLFDFALGSILIILNYGSLVLFWALRLELSFEGTIWEVSPKAKMVIPSLCISSITYNKHSYVRVPPSPFFFALACPLFEPL